MFKKLLTLAIVGAFCVAGNVARAEGDHHDDAAMTQEAAPAAEGAEGAATKEEHGKKGKHHAKEMKKGHGKHKKAKKTEA